MIYKNKIKEIVAKISTLTEIYAKVHNLDKYLFNYYADFTALSSENDLHSIKNSLLFKKINFTDFIKKSTDVEVLNFFSKVEGLVSNTELEMLFIEKYYYEYAIILNILQMLMYDIPRQINESDLIELNKLYKKYNTDGTTKKTFNTNM
jgi:hypothetical protein